MGPDSELTESIAPDFGRRMKAVRGYLGDVSQTELAERLGRSQGWVRAREDGKGLTPLEQHALVDALDRLTGWGREFFLDQPNVEAAPDGPEDRRTLFAIEGDRDPLAEIQQSLKELAKEVTSLRAALQQQGEILQEEATARAQEEAERAAALRDTPAETEPANGN